MSRTVSASAMDESQVGKDFAYEIKGSSEIQFESNNYAL
jgi:hypothetical protein